MLPSFSDVFTQVSVAANSDLTLSSAGIAGEVLVKQATIFITGTNAVDILAASSLKVSHLMCLFR